MVFAEFEPYETLIHSVDVGENHQGFYPLLLNTRNSDIHCRYYPSEGTRRGVIWVGGVGGGWDTPAQSLYPLLCQSLQKEGIASLRIRYRYSTRLQEAVFDVLAGISYLQQQEGIESIALVGHSFGGAVVIQAAAQADAVRTVVALATQAHGADPVPQLATRCSLLLLHGIADPVLTPLCSRHVYEIALEPKRLILYPEASHNLDEVADEVYATVRAWIIEQLVEQT